jgi:hypothetical protein
MVIANALNLLHFREKNRQVPATCVDLGRRAAPRRAERRRFVDVTDTTSAWGQLT